MFNSEAHPGNRLLASLPLGEHAMVSAAVERTTLEIGQTLHRSGEMIDHVYLVESGFISAMAVLSDGQPLEVGLIGSEGVAGGTVLLGAQTSYCETMCQTGGEALRIRTSKYLRLMESCPIFRAVTLKYLHMFHAQVVQTAACNAHHDLSQRLARWLLSAHDRSGTPELSLTQDLISIMLGVRRSTVSVAAATLQRAGIIRYQHGKITIVDRVGLENAACECYEAISGEYRRLFGEHPKDIVRPHRFTT
ncbi:Crp/Fnr family transcriptional regulator [Hyphomonas chukchiensis]|nr:Crp/Fnr family transcriptional regulator [Hyphomonas chukchiensis]